MEFSEAAPFLAQNHTAVVSTVTASGAAQATVVGAALYHGQVGFISRADTVKVKNARRRGRATVTVIRPSDNRYVTVEGPVSVYGWDNTERAELLRLLRDVYQAMGRSSASWADFEAAMEREQRTLVLVQPERVYGSLTRPG